MRITTQRRSRLRKKAFLFGPMMLLTVIFVFAFAVTEFWSKYTNEDKGLNQHVGQRSGEVFSTYQDGEELIHYLQQAGRYASIEAAFDLGMAGGFSGSSSCGTFGSFKLWNTKDEDNCMSSPPNAALIPFLDKRFKDRLELMYPGVFPLETFHYYIDDERIIGTSAQDLRLNLVGVPLKNYPITYDDEELIRQLILRYKEPLEAAIDRVTLQNPDDAPLEMAIAIIAVQSRGKTTYVDQFGCAGLFGICEEQAREFPGAFNWITPCDCIGFAECRVNAKCHAGNDDRLIEEKAIFGGVAYLRALMEEFEGERDNRRLVYTAYASREDIVSDALSFAKKTTGDNDFEKVFKYISPALLGERHLDYLEAKGIDDRVKNVKHIRDLKDFGQRAISFEVKIKKILDESDPNIPPTGQAIAKIPRLKKDPPSIAGSYYLKPTFNTPNVVGLRIYPELFSTTLAAVKECNRAPDCFQERLEKMKQGGIDLKLHFGETYVDHEDDDAQDRWLDTCEDINHKPLNDFVAFLQECEATLETDCLCERSAESLWHDGYDGVEIAFTGKDGLFEGVLSLAGSVGYSLSFSLPPLVDTLKSFTLTDDEITLKTSLKTITSSHLAIWKEGLLLRIANHTEDGLRMPNGVVKPWKDVRFCPGGTLYMACISDKQNELPVYNPQTRWVSQKAPLIRFALYDAGTPPPIVTNVVMADAQGHEQSILIAWDALTQTDVNRYVLYWSEEDLGAMEPADMMGKSAGDDPVVSRLQFLVEDADDQQGRIILATLGAGDECRWDTDLGLCYYMVIKTDSDGNDLGESYELPLEKETLYLFNKEQFVYLHNVTDGQKTHAAILARNLNGLESEEKEAPDPTVSIDDYPPPVCGDAKLEKKAISPGWKLKYSCTVKERQEDIDELIMEYRIYDVDGKPQNKDVQKQLVWSVPFETSDEVPRITFRDTIGNGISKVEYRILTKQNQHTYQEEFYDLLYSRDMFVEIEHDWLGLFIEPCAIIGDPTSC